MGRKGNFIICVENYRFCVQYMQLREPSSMPSLLIWHFVVFYGLNIQTHTHATAQHSTPHANMRAYHKRPISVNVSTETCNKCSVNFTIYDLNSTAQFLFFSSMNSSQILTGIIWYQERNELVSQQNGRASYTNNIVYLI